MEFLTEIPETENKQNPFPIFFSPPFFFLQVFLPSLEQTQTVSCFTKEDVDLLQAYLTKPLISSDSVLVTLGKGKT